MIDPDGFVANWNVGAERIKGYRAEEIIGQHFSRFYTEEDRAAGVPAFGLSIAAREGRCEREGWRVRKDGTRFWAHTVIDPIRGNDGGLIGFAKITRDITERRKAAEELAQIREQLFQSQKLEAMGQLAGGIAHDFNNLLTVVTGGVELAERYAAGNEKQQRFLRSVRAAAARGAALTMQLLAFSRRQPLRPEVIRPAQIMHEAASLLGRSLPPNIDLVIEAPAGLPTVEVDPNQLQLAILNIGLNARDAMPNGGTLRLCARDAVVSDQALGLHGDYVVISIADDGTGIPTELLHRVIEPFYTTKDVGKGSGLGLSQAYGFAKQSHGTLTVESTVGRGTEVTIYVPASEARPRDIGMAAAGGGHVGGSQGRVLVVEDDPDIAELATALLEQAGYRTRHVNNAGAALGLLDTGEAFDLVFSDIVMPGGMSGLDLAQALRARHPGLPVLLVTGFSAAALSPEARGFPIIRKPYDLRELTDAVAKRMQASRPAARHTGQDIARAVPAA